METTWASEQDLEVHRRRLNHPSAWIIALAFVSCCVDVMLLAEEFISPMSLPHPGAPELSVLLALHLYQLIGGLRMRQMVSYWVAFSAVITCCIPCFSPLVLLGIPAGLYVLPILMQPEIRHAFTETRAR